MVLNKILLSPQFLYKSEVGNLTSVGVKQLDPYEKATFISYGLTGTTPDKELYELAKSGEMTDANIRNQVRRLLSKESTKTWLNTFFRDWLRLDKLTLMKENPNAFSKFKDKELPGLLNQEFDLFIESIVFNQSGTTTDLLSSKKTFANSKTGFIYNRKISSNRMVEIDQGEKRAGVLTLASVLASHSSDISTEKDKPVHRGVLIQNQILCENVGLPSGLSLADAEAQVSKEHPNFEDYTVRRQYEVAMNQGPTCTNCHSQFMQFGYLSSNFNALGEYKTEQAGQLINSRANPSIAGYSLEFEDVSDFTLQLASSQNYKHCFSQKLGSFIIGNAKEMISGQMSWLMWDHHESSGGSIKAMLENIFADSRIYQRGSK